MLTILQFIACVATVATGLFSLLAPKRTEGFTGLSPVGGRGVTEIRSILGGLFIVLGAAPLIMDTISAYQILGYSYLGIAVVRLFSIYFDKSGEESSNWISLGVELVLGVILIL